MAILIVTMVCSPSRRPSLTDILTQSRGAHYVIASAPRESQVWISLLPFTRYLPPSYLLLIPTLILVLSSFRVASLIKSKVYLRSLMIMLWSRGGHCVGISSFFYNFMINYQQEHSCFSSQAADAPWYVILITGVTQPRRQGSIILSPRWFMINSTLSRGDRENFNIKSTSIPPLYYIHYWGKAKGN